MPAFAQQVFYLYLYLLFLLIGFFHIPNCISIYYENRKGIIILGFIGLFRYSWWLLHLCRSMLYHWLVFPMKRKNADLLWMKGWRPKRLFIMMTTFQEIPTTTELVLQSIVTEYEIMQVPILLFIGIGSDYDEKVIHEFKNKISASIQLQIKCVRQTKPGKRNAIVATLQAILSNDVQENDIIVFLDGDTIFHYGCLAKCIPFFQLYSNLQALTTHEEVEVINGPIWFQKWLEMRFVQRHLIMQSHALSNKVLTLTGRMSIFRGKFVRDTEFLELIENDYLTHWLWGKFRFLSGDDKTTWYYLLSKKAAMLYIPDAITKTIENINGSAFDRLKQNLLRWSGNTLRNGARAIALGPKKVGWFIWLCLLDQRLTTWTWLIGFMITIVLLSLHSVVFIYVSVLWVFFSRLCLSAVLFSYNRKIDMSYPFILYLNQVVTSLVKIYMIFRLPQQRWKNRGDQHTGFHSSKRDVRQWIANSLIVLYGTVFMMIILLSFNLISFPTVLDLKFLLTMENP